MSLRHAHSTSSLTSARKKDRVFNNEEPPIEPDTVFSHGHGLLLANQPLLHSTAPLQSILPPVHGPAMSADFWAGYLSGATGILIGNPLDIVKTRLQAGGKGGGGGGGGGRGGGGGDAAPFPAPAHASTSSPAPPTLERLGRLVRGSAAPVLGYGALNGILYFTYNRSLQLLGEAPGSSPSSSWKAFAAGAAGGFASFAVSAPTELVKCRAQVCHRPPPFATPGDATAPPPAASPRQSSWQIAREIYATTGLRGFYLGGAVTSLRDCIGYGFYFWSYELLKRSLHVDSGRGETEDGPAGSGLRASSGLKILLAGGVAGVVTWASIFPLDVVKTRVQVQALPTGPGPLLTTTTTTTTAMVTGTLPVASEDTALLGASKAVQVGRRKGAIELARTAYQTEGLAVFFRGLGVCSVRAFIVNAVQWAVYEWMMRILSPAEGAGGGRRQAGHSGAPSQQP